jgi:uncharacterized protein YfkK (UPF0435 family)
MYMIPVDIKNIINKNIMNVNDIRDVRVDNHLEAIYDIIIKKLIWK